MQINPLVGCPSPRDIPRWIDAMKKLDFVDRLYAKYFIPEKYAYDFLRNYFLEHKEYTHLVLLPDDLIVEPDQLRSLIKSVEENDYMVFSGVANMDNTLNKNTFAISTDVIHIERDKRRFSLLNREQLEDYQKKGEHVQVMWAGFPCMFIRRDVVNVLEFNSDGIVTVNNNGISDGFVGCCTDTVFCWECYILDIPIFIDPKIEMLHLKISDNVREHFNAGTPNYSPYGHLEKKKKVK